MSVPFPAATTTRKKRFSKGDHGIAAVFKVGYTRPPIAFVNVGLIHIF
jgi:hypothetical protein